MRLIFSYFILITSLLTGYCQKVKISFGNTEIAANQSFTITLTLENEKLKSYSSFPDLQGFQKRETSSSTSTTFINGQMTSSQSITQNYIPVQEGNYRIPKFQISVNGVEYAVDGTTVKVGPPAQRQRQRSRRDPFDLFDLFDDRQETQPKEFLEVDADAFLALTTDKKDVFVGEGFTATLAFYVSKSNKADMRFYQINKQVTDIVKKIKPSTCWEENFEIDNISGQSVKVNGRPFTQYKIFQAAFFPLNEEDITFESVGLKLIKYKIAKQRSFFGSNRQQGFETFYSKPKTVKVNPLPPHPLKESVSVGVFELKEDISRKDLKTTESFNYSFRIKGRGNIGAIKKPYVVENDDFDFYDPNIRQEVKRSQNIVSGSKAFNYYIIPNEPGNYNLGNYMNWVYFDPSIEVYDTLRSNLSLFVSGQSRRNEYISSTDLGSFYDRISFEDNKLRKLKSSLWPQIVASTVVFFVMVFSIYWVKRNSGK